MKDCFKRFLLPSLALIFFSGAFFGSCTDVDNQLGLGLLPDDQDMQFTETTIYGINSYTAFSDSLPVNQLNLMVLGNYTTKGFGHIRSGAAVNFRPVVFSSGPDLYGFRPKFDSLTLNLSVDQYFGDTTKEQKFYVYPIKNPLPLRDTLLGKDNKDSIAYRIIYGEFPAEEYADLNAKLFSFNMKGHGKGNITKSLKVEPAGDEFVKRLINYNSDKDFENYNKENFDDLFRGDFPGFYIAPSNDPSEADPKGALYLLSPISTYDSYNPYLPTDNTAIYMWYNTHYNTDEGEEVPEGAKRGEGGYFIKDSLAYTRFSFDDSYGISPGANIMAIKRDYTGAPFVGNYLDTPAIENFQSGSLPSEETIYIQGLHGVAGYLDFGDEFLKKLNDLKKSGQEERILHINRARLFMWLKEDTNENLDLSPTRLGMYYFYSSWLPKNIPDYYYSYEQSQDAESGYGGYLNRALGYYEMDITMYLRDLLSDENTPRQIWLGPGHTTGVFYAPNQVVIQNPSGDDPKRMQLKLSYTLLKKTINE